MGNINDRILLVREAVSKSNLDFAKQLGEERSTVIDNITKGETEPKYWILEKIVTTFLVSAEWLITGNGEMFNKNNSEPMKQQSPDREIIEAMKVTIAAQAATIRRLENRGEIEALEETIKAKDELLKCYAVGTPKKTGLTIKDRD